MKEVHDYFLSKEEPVKSCMLALRKIILDYREGMTETWKYRMPCYCYHDKMFCYLWTDKKQENPMSLSLKVCVSITLRWSKATGHA